VGVNFRIFSQHLRGKTEEIISARMGYFVFRQHNTLCIEIYNFTVFNYTFQHKRVIIGPFFHGIFQELHCIKLFSVDG
jgi:hypothetical protein